MRRLFAWTALFVLLAAGVALSWVLARPFAGDDSARVFLARNIVTMEPARPNARAVAIEGGRIVAVGSAEEVLRAVDGRGFTVDRRFAADVLLPGFIDPHIHPTLAATILPMDIVSAVSWKTPTGTTPAVRGHEPFLARLRALDAQKAPGDWLLVWGYHEPYHGELSRARLDAISRERPIFVWQRSVHEMYFNTRALEELGMSRASFDHHAQADWAEGRLWERGMLDLGRPMIGILASPGTYSRGLSMMSEVLHRGGLTTVAEQGFPQTGVAAELVMLHLEMARPSTSYRFVLVPNAMFLARREGAAAGGERAAAGLLRFSTDAIRVVKHAKYYADGAIFSQLMQMTEPYTDGHRGEWMMTPAEQREVLAAFWERGWDMHIHVNGDAGVDTLLEQVEAHRAQAPDGTVHDRVEALRERAPGGIVREHVEPHRGQAPYRERRIVLEHYGYAREDQHARVARAGVAVSNNAYYLHELAPVYARSGLGPERAADISPLGGLHRAGVRFSFHSDFPMAPAEPLTLVWVAVNRIASDGAVWGKDQRIPLEAALRAVTVEAAWSIGLEDEIGSIRAGKRADFTVLEDDPHDVPPAALRDIKIRGTVVDGRFHAAR